MAKYRKMLSNWDAPYIQSLIGLIETQSKETLIRWSTDYAEARLLPIYETRFPHDPRPREAITAACRWLGKEIKLPEAKPAILACHEAAREADSDPTAQAAARAIGQSASTIHAPTHVAGLALYGALAVPMMPSALTPLGQRWSKPPLWSAHRWKQLSVLSRWRMNPIRQS